MQAGQQKDTARFERCKHVVLFQKAGVVAGDEVGLLDEIGLADQFLAESQMRNSNGARLLGVIDKVALGVVVCLFADDLDGVFICAHGSVGAKTVEHRAVNTGLNIKGCVNIKADVCDVVVNADGELLPGLCGVKIVQYRPDRGGGEFL